MPSDGGRGGDPDEDGDDPWGEDDGSRGSEDRSDDAWSDAGEVRSDGAASGAPWADEPTLDRFDEPAGGGPRRSTTPLLDVDPRTAARALGVGVGLSVAAIVASLVVLVPAILAVQGLNVSLTPVLGTLLSLALIQYVAFGSVVVGYTRYRDTTVRAYVAARVPGLKDLLAALGGWVLTFGLVIVLSIIVQFLGVTTGSNSTAEAGMQNPELFLVLIPASFLVIGPMEELMFRGVVQGRLRETFTPVPAVAVSALLFAAVHVMALTGSLTARINTIIILFFPSLVFGALYEYTDNLAVPALVHALYDATLFGILYVVIVFGPEDPESTQQAVAALLESAVQVLATLL